MPSEADRGSTPTVEPLGVVSLRNATAYPFHPSPDPHRVHYGVRREDGTLLESTVQDRQHGTHTFIPCDPTRFDAVDSIHREVSYAGPLYQAYGHFLLESCQRLWWAADRPHLPIVWTIEDGSPTELNRWQKDVLEILGVRNEVLLVSRPTRIDRLHVPDAGYRYADYSHPQHIAFLAAHEGPAQEPGARLWLSRDPAHGRGLVNRHIVERRLHDLGWTIVTFELMPVRAQLDALARAEVIAGEEASTFHNLLLLTNIRDKQFHVFRRHGPEHLSFGTIGAARDVNQQFHSCHADAVVAVQGRAVTRLAPNAAQYLDHLGIPVPPAPSASILAPALTLRRLNRLASVVGADTFLQLGAGDDGAVDQVVVGHRDVVDDELGFDVRSRPGGSQLYEVSLDEFLTWFAGGRRYDLVLVNGRQDWRASLADLRAVFARGGHDRTVALLNHGTVGDQPSGPGERGRAVRGPFGLRCRRWSWSADVHKTLLALHDLHPGLDFRTIVGAPGPQTVVWQRSRSVSPRFGSEDVIQSLSRAELDRHHAAFATVTEDAVMTEIQRWLVPNARRRVSRLASRIRGRLAGQDS